jgi:hypothetical protein
MWSEPAETSGASGASRRPIRLLGPRPLAAIAATGRAVPRL